jgi:hypothetical protein
MDGNLLVLYIVIFLVDGAVFSVISRWIAFQKGKDSSLWPIIGFFLGILAVIVLAVAPSEQELRDRYISQLNGLLKLKESNLISEEFFNKEKERLLAKIQHSYPE